MQKFFSGLLGQLKKFNIIIIALLALGGLFSYYLIVVVDENEQTIKERGFRGLANISEGFSNKVRDYKERNSKNFLKEIQCSPGDSDLIKKAYTLKPSSLERVASVLSPGDSAKDFFVHFDDEWRIYFKPYGEASPNESSLDLAYTSVAAFIRPLLRYDLFSKYVLLDTNYVLFNDTGISIQTVSYEDLNPEDTLNHVHHGIIQDIETGGVTYKLFLIPFSIDQEKTWIIGGLIPEEAYYREKMYISDNVLLVLIFCLFIVFVSLPFLKALIMNKEERLNSGDVVFSFMSFTVLASIIVIVAWDLYGYNGVDRESTDKQLGQLAELVGNNLHHEVDAALKQLDVADQVLQKNPNILDSKFKENELCDTLSKHPLMKMHNVLYPFFSHIVWADGMGNQMIRWTTDEYVPTKINIADRPYFINVKKDRLWVRDGREYYLETINSWVRSEALAIVSKRSDVTLDSGRVKQLNAKCGAVATGHAKDEKMAMVALSAPFKSVFDPAVPDGFGYCVIDRAGKVLFHTNKNRILNENFIGEAGGNYLLTSAIKARSEEFFEANYYGKPQRFFITPLEYTPYYVITFRELKSLKSSNTEVIAVSTIFLLIHFFFIMIITLLIQLIRFRAGKLKSVKLRLTWLMPADSNRVGYLKAIACFVDSFVVLLIFCKFSDPLYTLGLVFSNSLLMILFAYIFLGVHGLIRHDERRMQQQRLASQKALSPDDKKRSLFRRFSFQFSNAMNEKRTSLWIPVIVVFVIYLVMATVLVLHLPSNRGSYLLSQVILWLVFWLIDRFRFRFETSAQWLAFRVRYVMMQFLFIVIIAIIPATVFFRITYNQEKKLEWKFRMLDFAQQMVSKEKVAPECSGAGFADFSYMQSYFLPFGKDTVRIGEMPAADREQPFDDIYDRVRPVFAENTGRINSMRANQSGDSLYRWKYHAKQNTLMVYYKDFRKKRMVQDSTYLQLSAIVSPIMLPNFINEGNGWLPAFLYWAGMVVFLLAFYFFMDFFIRKVFFLKVLDTRSIAGIDEQLLKNKNHQAHLFVVGLPQSGKSATVKKYYTDAKHGTNEFDFAQLLTIPVAAEGEDAEAAPVPNEAVTAFKAYYEDDPSEAHPKFLLLHHFEFQHYDPAISLRKLEFLEEWIFKPHLRIILLSATQSLAFIEHAQRKAVGETDADVSSRNLSYRWLNVMNHFYLLYHPLQGYREISTYPLTLQYEKNTDQSSHEQVLHMLNGIIERECSHGEFLEGIKTELHTYVQKAMEQAKDEPKDKQEEYMPESLKIMLNFASDDDELILKVQSLSQNYYQSLWDALSVDERKLVYDMAQDGLVNHQNIDIINLLINKGLFVVEGSVPRMMNKSFRNFVLTQLVGEDLQQMETALSEGGTWQRLRPAIIIVLVVVAGFIFITQRETFNSMLGYLGAFAGGILALLRLFDSVAPKSGSS